MASELTTDSYINHHLTNLKCGKTDAGWTCDPYAEMGFWSFHVDSLLWSVILGCVFLFVFKKATPKKGSENLAPKGLQNFAEMCIEFVEDNVQSMFGSIKNTLVAPLALTVFVWILLMNLMDLVPVDFIPVLAGHIAAAITDVSWIKEPDDLYFKVVPTTDPNITLGMAFAVFILTIYYSITVKGIKAFVACLLYTSDAADE